MGKKDATLFVWFFLALLVPIAVLPLLPERAQAQATVTGSTRRLTTDPAPQIDPAISGNLVVYTDLRNGNADVYYIDLTTCSPTCSETRLTTGSADEQLNDISGNLIVYTDFGSGNGDIKAFDVSTNTTTTVSADAAAQVSPAVGGSLVAWQDYRDGNYEIYAKDLATGVEKRLTNTATFQERDPAVSGRRVVYTRTSASDCQIYVTDFDSLVTAAVTAVTGCHGYPDISGNTVVYQGDRDGNQDIFVYNLSSSTETRITLSGLQRNPNVSGDWVAFEDVSAGNSDIRLYHVPTGSLFTATATASNEFLNDIDASGNAGRIAYTGDTGGNLDIYVYEFTATFPFTPISGCTTISSPGQYILTGDIVNSTASPCISITSSDVVLEGDGYEVDGIRTANSVGVQVGIPLTEPGNPTPLTNVTVRNLNASDWGTGIYFYATSNGSIFNNNTYDNDIGIKLDVFSTGNSITVNLVDRSLYYGIVLDQSSNNNSLADNAVTSTTNVGVIFSSSDNETFKNNHVTSNGYGIKLVFSDNNTIYNNNFNNTANTAGFVGTNTNNTWNVAPTPGTNIVGGPNIAGNFWGNPWGTGFSQTCADTNLDGICDSPYTIDTANNTVNTDLAPLRHPDTAPPTIGLTCSATATLRSAASAVVNVTDAGSGVAYQSNPNGANALDTSSVGTKTFTVTARDNAGNQSTNSCTYRVIYDFQGSGGFQSPVQNPPVVNTAKAGSAVPVKWQLPDGAGGYISDLSVVLSITFGGVPCGDYSSSPTNEVTAPTAGSSGLRYDSTSNQFIYTWKTDASMAGKCYVFILRLDDGTEYRANFQLR